ncbi:MAG: TonB-dependent receptor domain-containing protein [Terriglobia bacterium]
MKKGFQLQLMSWGTRLLAGIVIGLVTMVPLLKAQTYRGTITGSVVDQSKAPVPGAKVTVRNNNTGLTRNTVTDSSGIYNVPELPLGIYTVTVEMAGFQPVTVPDLQVNVAAERRVDVTISPSKMVQQVEVHAEVPLVQTSSDVLGGTVQASQIAELPFNGRDFLKAAETRSGVAGSADNESDSAGSYGIFSVNGARGRSNNFLLDGTDMNDGFRNLPALNEAGTFGTPATTLPLDSIAEVNVLSEFPPEYGRNSGSVVNIVTKSGTNQVHGSAYEYFRDTGLNARNFFNPAPTAKSPFHNNQYGGDVGGPIVKDKLFYFANWEGQRESLGVPSEARVPSPAEISALGGPTNPVISALLQRNPWPAPNIPNVPLFAPVSNVFAVAPASNNMDEVIGKIDDNINDRNLLAGRYYFGNTTQSFPLGLQGAGILPGYNTLTPVRAQVLSLSEVATLSPTKVNEARFGWIRYSTTFEPEDSAFRPSSIGLDTGSSDGGLPFITVPGYATVGANNSDPRGRGATNWQFIDDYSWTVGGHSFKFGYQYYRTDISSFFDAAHRGTLTFNGSDLQTALAQFLSGIPTGGSQTTGNSRRNTTQGSNSLYAQDTYRATPRLTLMYGLRWDYYGVLGEKNNLLSNFSPAVGLALVGTKTFPNLYDKYYKNFGPRASIAYDLTGKGTTVLRAGWGMFYDNYSQDMFIAQLPFNTSNAGPAFNGIGPDPILFGSAAGGVPLSAGTPIYPASSFSASSAMGVDPHFRTPYMEIYNLNIQQQLGKNAVFQIGYVGSEGHHLLRYRDINQATPAAIAAFVPSVANGGCCATTPFANGPFLSGGGTFGYVNWLESSANSNYNALQASLRITSAHGLTSEVNYTWSHSLDNSSDGQDYVPNASQPNNSYNAEAEYANSNFDLPQKLTWMLSYPLPKLADEHGFGRVVNGWSVSSVLAAQSGQPFTVNYTYDNYDGSGEYFPRPDLVGNPFANTSTPNNFLNLSAFAVPCTLNGQGTTSAYCEAGTQHFGNLGRNFGFGPSLFDWDFSLVKEIPITERVKMEFRGDFFNILNHPNFVNPLLPSFLVNFGQNGLTSNGRGIGYLPLTTTPDIGIGDPVLGGGAQRSLQFALRLMF